MATLHSDNASFAFALHRDAVAAGANSALSPYSIAVALAMTRAGARNNTAAEIDAALRFSLRDDALHRAFNATDLALASREAQARSAAPRAAMGMAEAPLQLRVVNALWAERTLPLESAYLDTLSRYYGAGVNVVDFRRQPEDSRRTINAWVASQTMDKIAELIPGGLIDNGTMIVLTNAVYLNARWQFPFESRFTGSARFTLANGTTTSASMMHPLAPVRVPFARLDGHTAVELPYVGAQIAMLVVVPDQGQFDAFERRFDASQYADTVRALTERAVRISLPKFSVRSPLRLDESLIRLGMREAFTPAADLTGISRERMQVTAVVHEAKIDVAEAGTEAAAATAVIAGDASVAVSQEELLVDRPFYWFIRDRQTGATLFMGRVLDPNAR
ncbi:MAG: serpin family protein [Myxococcales bacterium]|nr:serpin family protein [Myxococcales bacterium]